MNHRLSSDVRRILRQQALFDREQAECDEIVSRRPLGVSAPRDEPKSIHSPAGRSRITREPPRVRQTTTGVNKGPSDDLPTGTYKPKILHPFAERSVDGHVQRFFR
ncbi:hypothetical protein [uncultured Methylobacterium sp.]|uniref:hypothetical protein n=1 Tax=uncultured Methylobacterium sp. TaxID=157278 RepID=UPI00260A11F7|nr:hypothetical protein [uncultured Methylobacterium sp.]